MGKCHYSIGNNGVSVDFSDGKLVHSVDSKRYRDSIPGHSNGTKKQSVSTIWHIFQFNIVKQ